ncbi:MAG: hypothetical protein HXY40_02295 [Chloroflexi bacterium]|nr:hypothetical protein [Chloroflexota bacterium]
MSRTKFSLSEDWLATIAGLIIVAVIGLGVLGPGPQTVTINAAAGEIQSKLALPLSGWTVSATIDGQRATVEGTLTALSGGTNLIIECAAGRLRSHYAVRALPAGVNDAPEDRGQIVVVNGCDAAVSVTYRTSGAIVWPLFNLFGR